MYAMAKDIMNVAMTTTATTPIIEIASVMETSRISVLPVVDPKGKLVGVVSKTDLIHVFLTQADQIDQVQAQHAMNPAVITCDPKAPLESVASTLIENHIHHVFVVDEESTVHVISALDLTRPLMVAYEMLHNSQSR